MTPNTQDGASEHDFWDFLPPERAERMRQACARAEAQRGAGPVAEGAGER